MKYEFSELSKDVLEKLYTLYGVRDLEIGNMVGITSDAIRLQRKKFGIENLPSDFKRSNEIEVVYTGQKRSIKDELTTELLKELYEVNRWTDQKIGEQFGMTGEGVAYRRKLFGIATRTAEDCRKHKNELMGQKDIIDLTKEELEQELKVYRGIKGIARKYQSTFNTVKSISENFGIIRNEAVLRHVSLTETQRKLIVAGLLGDGGLYEKGAGEYYYKEGHSLDQLDYLKWKMDLFGDMINGNLKFSEKIMETGIIAKGALFNTHPYAELKEFRDKFYRYIDNKFIKIIPEDAIEAMDCFLFSIWYFDDGGLSNPDRIPQICSGSPESEVLKAIEILNRKFNLESYIEKMDSVSLIKIKNIDNFFKLVKDYVPSCMRYKIPVSHRFDITGLPPHIKSLKNILREYTPDKWKKLGTEDKEKWTANVMLYYQFVGFPYYKIYSKSKFLETLKSAINQKINVSQDVFYRISKAGADICNAYFPHMWAAKVYSRKTTLNNYTDSIAFKKVVENVFEYRSILSESSIRNELRLCSTVFNFKPLIARYLYDTYCPENGVVFDYCAGWGGRLLGSYISSKVHKYIGVDPCVQTFLSLRKLQRRLDMYVPGKECSLLNFRSEDESIYEGINNVDFCFSSPPYFDTEKYSEESTQSYRMYPTVERWLEGFLKRTIKNCKNVLKDGGYFGINIADTSAYRLAEPAYNFCKENFVFEKAYLMVMPGYFGKEKYEPIFIFRKKEGDSPSYQEVLNGMEERFKSVGVVQEELIRGVDYDISTYSSPMTELKKKEAIEELIVIYNKTNKVSREFVKDTGVLSTPVWVLERDFGSWNEFVKASGLNPEREIHTPGYHVESFFQACLKSKRLLSFYEYEFETKNPSTRLKRLFNTGKPYHHLLEELKSVALQSDLWPAFLEKFK